MNWERNQTSAGQPSAASVRAGTAFGGGAGRALAVTVVVLLLVYLGAMVWSVVAPGIGSLILVLSVVPLLFIGVALVPWVCGGYRLLGPGDTASLMSGSVWHSTAQDWAVGDMVILEQARCRRSARMFRSDRLFTRSQQAVYLFAEPPSRHHVNGNVKGARARYLYTLAPVRLDGPVYRRETAVAVAGNVVATVTSRDTWTR
ncbi:MULTISPECIES: hypothetical protein [Curtobacterium]|uniref:hypothetical protein n=1 Tax=Curtobacterium TaxID=2034 RepID=UPI0012E05C1C|nr:hypothetical protein [Curtobacterium flaccumfaciens]MCU0116585.1 hypothetical protein [Curtobacterium flaccumfaciens]